MTNRVSFSRRDARPRHAVQRVDNFAGAPSRHALNRRWDRLSARSCFGKQMQSQPYNLFRNQAPEEVLLGSLPAIKGGGTPVDADPYPPHPAVRLCLPLGKQLACRRSTRGSRPRDFRPQGSASGHASWDAAGAYDPLIALPGEERTPLHGRYPRRACPSPVKHLTRRS